MADSAYQVAPVLWVRIPGAPYDEYERLETPRTAAAARRALALQEELEKRVTDARLDLDALPFKVREKAAHALKLRKAPPAAATGARLAAYAKIVEELQAANQAVADALSEELPKSRANLYESARTTLRRMSLFASETVFDRLDDLAHGAGELPSRGSDTKAREEMYTLYLQRACVKVENIGEFGPGPWTVRVPGSKGLALAVKPGISDRDTFLEKWVFEGLVVVMNADPEVRPEVAPYLSPFARREKDGVWQEDRRAVRPLSAEERALLDRIDGRTPAHRLGDPAPIERLAADGVLRWQVEARDFEPYFPKALLEDVRGWRDGAARKRWEAVLVELIEMTDAYRRETGFDERRALMTRARELLQRTGVEASSGRKLYRAINPISEETTRDIGLVVGDDVFGAFENDAAPWLDLWRDSICLASHRVGERLADLFRGAPRRDGRVTLLSFAAHCKENGIDIAGNGMLDVSRATWGEIRQAWTKRMEGRADAPEWELTADDCRFVRDQFEFERYSPFSWPTCDLQLLAKSPEAVARGEYRWMIHDTLHGGHLIQHAIYWCCPDRKGISESIRRMSEGLPFHSWGPGGVDFSVHTTTRWHEVVPDLWTYVGPRRGRPEWKQVPPSGVEVVAMPGSVELRLREIDGGRDIGSLTRFWRVGWGLIPFQFERPIHMPRLRMGRVIVQPQGWQVRREELEGGPFHGTSPALMIAAQKLKAKKGWPRRITVQPNEKSLPRGIYASDKDLKPIHVDFESHLTIELLNKWLNKYQELEVREEADADDLVWRESDGRRIFLMRGLIAPRLIGPARS